MRGAQTSTGLRLDLGRKQEQDIGVQIAEVGQDAGSHEHQISRFFTSSAFSSMNFLRASTSSPMSVVKMVSHSAMSSSFTDNSVRRSGSIVVSQSCGAVISPRPL